MQSEEPSSAPDDGGFARLGYIVALTQARFILTQNDIAARVNKGQHWLSRLLANPSLSPKTCAHRRSVIEVCARIWGDAVSGGMADKHVVKSVFNPSQPVKEDLKDLRKPYIRLKTSFVHGTLEAVRDALVIPRTASQVATTARYDDIVFAVGRISLDPKDRAGSELAYQTVTRFIEVTNAYPPETGMWHEALGILGITTRKLITRGDDLLAAKLDWATSLAFHAAGKLAAAHKLQSPLVDIAPEMSQNDAAAVTVDHARLTKAIAASPKLAPDVIGSYKSCIRWAQVSLDYAQRDEKLPDRIFTALETIGYAEAALCRWRKAIDALDADAMRKAGVDETKLPLHDKFSIELGREIVAARAEVNGATVSTIQAPCREHLRRARDPKNPMPAVAAQRRRVLKLLSAPKLDIQALLADVLRLATAE